MLGYLRAQGAREPEDLTSEVFLRVFDRLPQFTGDEPHFRSWLFTIAHRILIDDARRRQRRPQTTVLGIDVETPRSATSSTRRSPTSAPSGPTRCSQSLPPDQRAVVALRVTADLSLEQVAEILGQARRGSEVAAAPRARSLRRRCEEVPA